MTIDVPQNAKKFYSDAVTLLQENLSAQRRVHDSADIIAALKNAVNEYPKFFEAWQLLGEVYLGTDQVLLAYLALKRAHYIQYDHQGVLTVLAEASLMLERPELSLKYIDMLIKDEGEVPVVVRKLQARALARAEKWEDAVRAFGECLAEDPVDGDTVREASEILSLLGYREESASVLADYIDPFRDFIENQPDITATGWIMSHGLVIDRLASGARKRAGKKELVAHPEDYRAWYELGNVFLDGEKWAAAIACYKRALRVHPDYYDTLYNMGIALEELGRQEEAMQLFEAAVEANPDEPDAYESIAELLEEISPSDFDDYALNYLTFYRQDPEAEDFDELEMKILPKLIESGDIALMLLLAHVYLLRDDTDKAKNVLDRIESAGGEEAFYQWLRGQTYYDLGEYDEAEKAFRLGLKNVEGLDRGDDDESDDFEPDLLTGLAELLSETARQEEAIKLLQDKLETLDPDGLSLLAELLSDSNPKEAIETWQKALEIEPEHVDSLLGIAEKLIDTGKTEEGIIYLEKALKTGVDIEEENDVIEQLKELYPEIGAPELATELEILFSDHDPGEEDEEN